MKSYIECYDDYGELICKHKAPFNVEVDCYYMRVYGDGYSGMKLRGKCFKIWFPDIDDFNDVDLSSFMDLEIDEVFAGFSDKGLLKLLELNCEKVYCSDKKLREIMNKYLSEPDPLMRDIQGCKYELAVNGYGDML